MTATTAANPAATMLRPAPEVVVVSSSPEAAWVLEEPTEELVSEAELEPVAEAVAEDDEPEIVLLARVVVVVGVADDATVVIATVEEGEEVVVFVPVEEEEDSVAVAEAELLVEEDPSVMLNWFYGMVSFYEIKRHIKVVHTDWA